MTQFFITIVLTLFLSSCGSSSKKTSEIAVDCPSCSENQRNIVILDSDETLLHFPNHIIDDDYRTMFWAINTPVNFADSFNFLNRLTRQPNTDVYIVTAASPEFAHIKYQYFYRLAGIPDHRMFSIRNFRRESRQRYGFNPNDPLIQFDRPLERQLIPGRSYDAWGSEISKEQMVDYILSRYPQQNIGRVTMIGNSIGDITPGINFSLTNNWNIRLDPNRVFLILLDVRDHLKLDDTKKNAHWLNQVFSFNTPTNQVLFLKQSALGHEMRFFTISTACLSPANF